MKIKYAVVSVMMAFMSLSKLVAQTADTSVATATNTIFAHVEKVCIPNYKLLKVVSGLGALRETAEKKLNPN